MPTYEYNDVALRPRITPEIEARAIADVELDGSFDDKWLSQLVPFRAYIIACLIYHATKDDMFELKIKYYEKEYNKVLLNARARSNTSSSASLCSGGGISGVRLFRG